MLEASKEILTDAQKQGIIEDFYVTRVGDDINLYMTHYKGEGNKDVHGAAWECFQKAAKIAKSMKLYAAGQDILTDAFSGNVKGAGPGSAEMSFEERGSEPLLFFMADKTEPSAYGSSSTRSPPPDWSSTPGPRRDSTSRSRTSSDTRGSPCPLPRRRSAS